MSKIKRAGAWLLAAALAVGMLPAAGAAVSSDNAKSYLKALDAHPGANSYLVDFDGDGSDELVLAWRGEHDEQIGDQIAYQVWSGNKQLTSGADYEVSVMSSGQTLVLCTHCPGDWRTTSSYHALQNGKWVTLLTAVVQFQPSNQYIYYIDDKKVTKVEYDAANAAYQNIQKISSEYGAHSVREQLANAVDTSVSGYEDVLSSLSASEKKALFDDLLCVDSLHAYDFRTVSDETLVSYLSNLYTGFFSEYGGRPAQPSGYSFAPADLTRLTQRLFARTIDYEHYPNELSAYRNGEFYVFWGGRGGPGYELRNKHLYSLGNGHYWATYEYWLWEVSRPTFELANVYGSLVRQNADGSWTMRGHFLLADVADPTAFTKPSSWAKTEIVAAQSANLIPAWTNPPLWTDEMTRLQFAELIVQFAEQATGKALTAAPGGTFADTKSEAVLKAYAAGIVNGTSATAFSPYDKLTREQLATMLWRAITYVQTETGKTALAAGGSLAGYTDASKVSSWAKDAVSALAQNGIMKGTSGTTLSPASSCTVEQSVLLVYRTYTKLQ